MQIPLVQSRSAAAIECLKLITAKTSRGEVEQLKKRFSQEYGLDQVLGNEELIEQAKKTAGGSSPEIINLLRKSAVRAKSGVAVVAIMIRPVSCPYNCSYCPTSDLAAKSYTGFEPAALRARQNDFDSGRQTVARLRQFELNGHSTSKIEMIVMGGTFNVQPIEYQTDFVKGAYDALNGFSSPSLDEAIKANETAPHRLVALTFETRPDCAKPAQVSQLLDWGATKIELGVQNLSDEKLRMVRRGHGIAETISATANCKDSFLKVCYHFMPGLYATPEEDVAMFRQMFEDERFRPDMLKIYPTLVIPNTELYDRWKKGEFQPYSTEQAADVIAECKRYVPDYVRIMRVDRDIPTHQIADGVKNLNLREYVVEKCREKGITCRCIRCRQAGISELKFGKKVDDSQVKLKRLDYIASASQETFLSFEDVKNDLLVGFLRLRKAGHATFRPEIKSNETAGVRELRVYGEHVAVGESMTGAQQHHGYGKKLLEEAEKIACEEWDCKKISVTSGVGVREYYLKRGYAPDGAYMSKAL